MPVPAPASAQRAPAPSSLHPRQESLCIAPHAPPAALALPHMTAPCARGLSKTPLHTHTSALARGLTHSQANPGARGGPRSGGPLLYPPPENDHPRGARAAAATRRGPQPPGNCKTRHPFLPRCHGQTAWSGLHHTGYTCAARSGRPFTSAYRHHSHQRAPPAALRLPRPSHACAALAVAPWHPRARPSGAAAQQRYAPALRAYGSSIAWPRLCESGRSERPATVRLRGRKSKPPPRPQQSSIQMMARIP